MRYIHIISSILYTIFGAAVLYRIVEIPINSTYCYILVLTPIVYLATQGIGVIEDSKYNENTILLDFICSFLPLLVAWDTSSLQELPKYLALFKVSYVGVAIVDVFIFTKISIKLAKNSTQIYNN